MLSDKNDRPLILSDKNRGNVDRKVSAGIKMVLHYSSSSSSSDTVQGSVLLPHYRTLEVRPGRGVQTQI